MKVKVVRAKPAIYLALPFGAENLTVNMETDSSSFTSEVCHDLVCILIPLV